MGRRPVGAWSARPERPVTLLDADTGQEIEPVYVDAVGGRPLPDIHVTGRINN